MKFEIKNPNAKQFAFAAELVAQADKLGWNLEESEIGFNPYSGWVYIWSEDEAYSFGICEYAPEGIQFVYTDSESGCEVIEDSLQELKDEVKAVYKEVI